eukprot:14772968-Alexandrium_andersonii.AAC.1
MKSEREHICFSLTPHPFHKKESVAVLSHSSSPFVCSVCQKREAEVEAENEVRARPSEPSTLPRPDSERGGGCCTALNVGSGVFCSYFADPAKVSPRAHTVSVLCEQLKRP